MGESRAGKMQKMLPKVDRETGDSRAKPARLQEARQRHCRDGLRFAARGLLGAHKTSPLRPFQPLVAYFLPSHSHLSSLLHPLHLLLPFVI